MKRRFWKTENERAADRKKLGQLRKQILATVEGCAVASDQSYREADLAIDFCEDVPALPKASVEQIVSLFEKAGAVAKVSSIHVNGWFGNYDKLAMTRILLEEVFQTDIDQAQDQIIFCGDSPNDAPMFGFFENSVGVANVLDYEDELEHQPTWLTTKPASAGFVELAQSNTGHSFRMPESTSQQKPARPIFAIVIPGGAQRRPGIQGNCFKADFRTEITLEPRSSQD